MNNLKLNYCLYLFISGHQLDLRQSTQLKILLFCHEKSHFVQKYQLTFFLPH